MEHACKTLCDLSTSHMCVICTGSNGKEWGQATARVYRGARSRPVHFLYGPWWRVSVGKLELGSAAACSVREVRDVQRFRLTSRCCAGSSPQMP